MHYDSKYKIEEATAKDGNRPALTNILVGRNKLMATDGYVLAIVPAETDRSELGKLLPAQAAKAAKGPLKNTKTAVLAEDAWRVGGVMVPMETDVPYPKVAKYWRDAHKQPHDRAISLDVGLLYNLAKAFGDKKLTLILPKHQMRPILVYTNAREADRPRGIIMPCTTFSPEAERLIPKAKEPIKEEVPV